MPGDSFSMCHLQHQEDLHGLAPAPGGNKPFVIKQAKIFPKMAKNTHTTEAV